MNQININTVPSIPMGIPKKGTQISWASDVVTKEKNSENKNISFDKNLKKKK
ncbi:MAG TPA: hypothetical protein VIV55_00695 [Flavobacterium sp.]